MVCSLLGRNLSSFPLREDAFVTLKVLTPHGEAVITLLDSESRDAGLNQVEKEEPASAAQLQRLVVRQLA